VLGTRLAEARHRLGITQAELARRVGTIQPTVAVWVPTRPHVDTLCRALGVDRGQLERAPEPNSTPSAGV